MCGITGFVSPNSDKNNTVLKAQLQKMTDDLKHRGPDDEGHYVACELGLALGFRRLAIQDLSPDGHQPMQSHDGRYEIVFNGEIYNFLELRKNLEAAGVTNWKGHSDTEVMLTAISYYGLDRALNLFDGMFAIALYDRKDSTLTLIRDRMGEKPLYYGWSGGSFLFSSELKAMTVYQGWQPKLCKRAANAFLQYSYIPAPLTIYEGIYKLRQGQSLVLPLEGLSAGTLPDPTYYWDPKKTVERPKRSFSNPTQAVDELEELLSTSISRRMVSDVPLGAFLSGGIDSSTVVALMQKLGTQSVKSYAIGFDDPKFDEAPHARAVANHLGTDHTELYANTDILLGAVEKLPFVYDEPFGDVSALPTLLLSHMTREHVTTALSGDGGDELFLGYPRYSDAVNRWRKRNRPLGLLKDYAPFGGLNLLSALANRPGRLGDKIWKKSRDGAATDITHLYEGYMSRWQVVDKAMPSATGHYFHDQSLHPNASDPLLGLSFADAVTYLPDDLLVKVDRASMAVSLEVRAPLLARDVVEFAWDLPSEYKVRDGVGKWALRQVLYRHVPQKIIDRPKTGFQPPLADWLRGPLRDWAQSLITDSNFDGDELLDMEPVRALWEEHLKGQRNWHFELWNVLMLQSWRRKWGI